MFLDVQNKTGSNLIFLTGSESAIMLFLKKKNPDTYLCKNADQKRVFKKKADPDSTLEIHVDPDGLRS